MEIRNIDNKEHISINPIAQEALDIYPLIQFEVSIRSVITCDLDKGGHIWFSFGDIERFIDDLQQLNETRKGNASLNNSTPEGLTLTISNKDDLGHLLMTARLVKAPDDYYDNSSYDITITYEIDPSSINSIIIDLKKLMVH